MVLDEFGWRILVKRIRLAVIIHAIKEEWTFRAPRDPDRPGGRLIQSTADFAVNPAWVRFRKTVRKNSSFDSPTPGSPRI